MKHCLTLLLWLLTCSQLAFSQIECVQIGYKCNGKKPHIKVWYDNSHALDIYCNDYSSSLLLPFDATTKPRIEFHAYNSTEYKTIYPDWSEEHRGTGKTEEFTLDGYYYTVTVTTIPTKVSLYVSDYFCVGNPLSFYVYNSTNMDGIEWTFKKHNIDPSKIGFERNPTVMVKLSNEASWEVLCKTEKETPIPYETIKEFFSKNNKDLENGMVEFELKLKYGDCFETKADTTAYYPQVKYNGEQEPSLDLNKETDKLELKIPPYDYNSLEHHIWSEWDGGRDCTEDDKLNENDSYRIILQRQSSNGPACPLNHYVNVFQVNYNRIDGQFDFFDKAQGSDGREGVILLSSKMSTKTGSAPTITITENGNIAEINPTFDNNYKFYTYTFPQAFCTAGTHTINIKYDDDAFLPHQLVYTLSSEHTFSEKINTTAPICKDEVMVSMPSLSNYKYSINNDNDPKNFSSDSPTTEIPTTLKSSIQIYLQSEQQEWQQEWEYQIPALTRDMPTFSYEPQTVKCYNETTTVNVEIDNNCHSDKLDYYWSIDNGSFNKANFTDNSITSIDKLTVGTAHSIKWRVTPQGKENEECFVVESANLPPISGPTTDISFTVSTTSTTCKKSNDGEIIITDLKGGNGGSYTFFMGDNQEFTEENNKLKIIKNDDGYKDYILTNDFYSSKIENGQQYSVVVKDKFGCPKSRDNISIDFQTPQMNLTTTAASCDLAENGKAVFTKKEGIRFEPDVFEWKKDQSSIPGNSSSNSSLGVGNYSIKFSGNNEMCTMSSTFSIVSNTYTFSSSTKNASCAAAPNGSAEISATISTNEGNKQGEFNPTCYTWTLQYNQSNKNITAHTTTTNTISGLLPGRYNVKINHDENCTSSTEVVIGTNTYNFQGTQYHDLSCVDASNGDITAQINKSGNGDFNINSYKWHVKPHVDFDDESNCQKISDDCYRFSLQGLSKNEYTLKVFHDEKCENDTTIKIDINDYSWSTEYRYLSCPKASNGFISANIKRGDDYTGVFNINNYSWTLDGNDYKKGDNSTKNINDPYQFTLEDLAPGLYRLSLTHDDKCTESTTVKIDVNQYSHFVNTTNAPCVEINSGSAIAVSKILSGTPVSFNPHYFWTVKNGETISTGSNNFITERYSGDYNVRLEWEGGCNTEINFDIKHDTLRPSFLTTHAECADKQSIGGKVEINMSPERTYRYIWDDDTEGTEFNIAENLAAGTHTVRIVDQHNCSIKESFNILNSDFSVNVKSENALCRQDATGKVIFDIKGGRGKYAIDWQGNSALSQKDITANTFTQDKVPVGVYTINVKDETNCVSTHKVTIASGNLKVSHKETEASCSSIGNARAEIAVSGAKLPVTYKWSDNVETPDPVRNNLTNGNYVVTVVDQNDCSMPVDIKIYSKKLSTATAIDSATCGLDPDGAAEIRLFSATSPFTFTWPDGKITSESKRNGLDKGNYDVLITDANGCEVHANVAIPHKGYLQNDVPSSINLCYNGEITVDANEFDGYEWICNGWVVDNNRFLTVKSPGTYIVKANGYDDCYAVDTISVTMSPTSFSPYFRMSSVSYINDTLVVMEMSQTNPDQYSWKYDTLAFDCDNSKGSERELRLIPKLSGIYSVTLSAENQDCVSDISKPVEIFATVRPDDEFSPLYVDNSIVKAFNLSPNPTKGPITVEVNLSQISDVRLTIYDLNFGKIRKQVTLRNSDNYKLDINDVISTGAYVVILQTGNETKQIKYIVSR